MYLTKMTNLKMTNHSYDMDIDFDVEWDSTISDINDIAKELNDLGWKYFSAGGYMGWNKSASNTGIYGLNGETLREVFFCYDTEMNIEIDFTSVHNGIFEVKMSHHDSPTGETVYFVKEDSFECEEEWTNPREHCIEVAIEKGLR